MEQEVYDEEPSLYMDETTPLGTDFLSKLSNNDLILLQNYLTKVSPPKNEAQDGRVNPTTFLPLGKHKVIDFNTINLAMLHTGWGQDIYFTICSKLQSINHDGLI